MAKNRFTRIPQATFNELQIEAGLLLKNFDPATGNFDDADIITATTGGIQVDIKPTISDFGEDVDNCPNKTKELAHVDDIEATISTTALNINEEALIRYLGPAEKDETSGAIVLRKYFNLETDFPTIWFVADTSDGGMVAVELNNALSTDGFSLKTSKKGKGNISVKFTGHYSIEDDTDVVPVQLYYAAGSASYGIRLSDDTAKMTIGDTKKIKATTNPAGSVVSWSSSDSEIASVSNGTITAEAAGWAVIVASITYDGTTYTDTVTVQVVQGEG